ncbi:hypothetical protein FGU65_01975 [Methanoculleus sp. FWC-SCC1]|uniref:DUF3426 domain-containing protein n=1 Tax=Methanoculleus frigidifontis TaxID=2584085 RepID=A0ABT8M6Y0_9EURY|nr:FxLYD domain-containing protein [Methanoculleus sp. FWC-SCC1]MDN7023676.1 hypothetical protein [Methanoculleus sp. FWC-SCC1]
MKIYPSVLLVLALICLASGAGCTAAPADTGGGETVAKAEASAPVTLAPSGPHPVLAASIDGLQQAYRADGTCYYTATVTVANTGDAAGRNVVARFLLVDDESTIIRSTETEFLPRLGPGEKKRFTKDLNGECDRSYHLEIETTYDIS